MLNKILDKLALYSEFMDKACNSKFLSVTQITQLKNIIKFCKMCKNLYYFGFMDIVQYETIEDELKSLRFQSMLLLYQDSIKED